MPIGPSHGARGGGFSGGSNNRSRGSSNDRGSGLGSFVGGMLGAAFLTAGARRRRRRYEERYGYNSPNDEYNSTPRRKAPTLFLVLAIITAVISAFTMTLRNGFVNSKQKYENTMAVMSQDAIEYNNLIEKAEAGTTNYYTTTAEFANRKFETYSDNPSSSGYYLDFILNGVSYYFIVYEYVDHTGATYKGTTYSQFSANQIQQLNGEIEISYFDDNGDHYSINSNYVLETCAEYKYYASLAAANASSAKTFLTAFIVELLIVALFVALYILKLKKYKKLVAQDEELIMKKQQAEVDKAEAEADAAQSVAERHNRFCQYCGGQLDADSNTCTSCGAKFSQE